MSEIKNENRKRTGLKFGYPDGYFRSQYPLAYAMASSATALLDLEIEKTAPKETKTGLPRIKSFKEWFVEKSLSEIESILIEEGYEPTEEHIIALLEAGFMDKIKKYGKAAALAGVLGASSLGDAEAGKAKNYSFDYNNLIGNKQAKLDIENDKEAERAGFMHGYHLKSATTLVEKKAISTIQKELEVTTKSKVFINIISRQNLGTGGKEVIVEASGEIQAYNEQQARQIIENKIKEVAQENKIELTGLKSLITPAEFDIKPTEDVGNQKLNFKTRISFKL